MGLATEFLVEHPVVGAGLGQDLLALNQLRGPTWRSVHNAYLNYGVDLGLPGLGLFLALLISTLHAVWKAERRLSRAQRFGELATFAHGLRVSLLTFAAAAFFYPVAYQFYFYYLAGLAVAVRAIAQRLRLEDLRDAI
jgi:O-antigen ligase